ncbi:MAG: cyclic nucleotide-binding domain-containing protein [Nitrospirae bacterium]|nr:cyclic nucleotide-binding domain-containing protein [Nitrospirota bacterium]
MSNSDLVEVEFLRKVQIFKDLSDEEFKKIAAVTLRRPHKEGERIVEEGTVGQAMFVVRTGYVKVIKKGERGDDVFLTVLAPGEHFGELSLVDRHPRSASVVAQRDCEIYEIPGESFHKLIEVDTKMAVKIYKGFVRELCNRLREADEVLTFGNIQY